MRVTAYRLADCFTLESDALDILTFPWGGKIILNVQKKKFFLRSSITFLYLKSNDPAATIVVAAKKKNKKWREIRFKYRPPWMISVAVKGVINKGFFTSVTILDITRLPLTISGASIFIAGDSLSLCRPEVGHHIWLELWGKHLHEVKNEGPKLADALLQTAWFSS